MEAHGTGPEGLYDKAKQAIRLETDRPHVLRQMMMACRKGGTLAIMGVYGGFVDKLPMGVAINKPFPFLLKHCLLRPFSANSRQHRLNNIYR